MRPGETLSLKVTLPNEQRIEILQAVVRWSRGQEFAVETIMIEPYTHPATALCDAVGAGASGERSMSTDRPKRETMSIKEATVSNMWEIAAIVEVLERKGICTKQDLHDIIDEFRRTNPCAKIPETAFPEPYLLTETENKIIDDILELLNKNGLTSHQSMNLLERLGRIIEIGQRVAKGTTH